MRDVRGHKTERMGDGKMLAAFGINVLLTVAQVIGGILSGSLSLIADALHNFGDAATLAIALFARKLGRKPPDSFKTFGYKRAETIAALVNLTTLVIVGLYLLFKALWRFIEPREIEGWTVVIVASIALLIDVATAVLTYKMSKDSMNIKAAFLHNVSDALASVGVIVAGTLILFFGWYWVDTLLTLAIAVYILWQGFTTLPRVIHLLMEGTPEHLSIDEVVSAMEALDGVENVHHVHIWQLNEHQNALETHVVSKAEKLSDIEEIKSRLKTMLSKRFYIGHSTLEFESVARRD